MTSGRRGEQVLLPPPPRGSSARLSCPRRDGSPTSRLPAAQQPAASPPLPRRSPLCPRSLVRRRSFLLCNKSVCSRPRDGSGTRPLTEGSVFTGFSGRWSSVLIFTVSGNSEACFQPPRLVATEAARKSDIRHTVDEVFKNAPVCALLTCASVYHSREAEERRRLEVSVVVRCFSVSDPFKM